MREPKEMPLSVKLANAIFDEGENLSPKVSTGSFEC
jgi:hypothetical protein